MAGRIPPPGSDRAWNGRAVANARAWIAATTTWPTTCPRCGHDITEEERDNGQWHLGHRRPRQTHPQLTWDRDNWVIEHPRCSVSAGAAQGNRLRPLTAIRPPAPKPRPISDQEHGSPGPSPQIPPPGIPAPDLELPVPVADALGGLFATRWGRDLADIPEDASVPAAMSPIHPDATGSYGQELERWAFDRVGVTLRWWQRLAFRMQLQHDADRRLLVTETLESTPRRAGKSVRLRVGALWRMDGGVERFGEEQLALHTGKDLPICTEIHRRAWPVAEGWGWKVRKQNGNESIQSPDGSRWMVRGRSGVYGYDVCLGMVDEAWAVEPGVVDDGLEPGTLERMQPQLLLTSTAHRRATPLMLRRLRTGLAGLGEDFGTLLLLWGAARDAPLSDEGVARAASPHWSAQRRDMIARKLAKALRGELDADAEDDDPVEGFRAQYLNVWPPLSGRLLPGRPMIAEDRWAALRLNAQVRPVVAAVESSPGGPPVVVLAGRLPDGRAWLSATEYPDTAAAAAGCAGVQRVLVGKSLLRDAAVWAGLPVEPRSATAAQGVSDLSRLLADGGITHDGSPVLAGQVTEARTLSSPAGIRLVSSGRVDAVKAAGWAAQTARAYEPWYAL